MSNAENFTEADNPIVLARKSWLAYVAPTFFYMAAIYALSAFGWGVNKLGAIALTGILVAAYLYVLLSIRSHMLFYNDNGVWVFSGIFPWNKGVSGVKWRDLDEAVFYQNFLSWVFSAYTLRVSHRFTREGEIRLHTMHGGDAAVQVINSIHQSLIANGNNTLVGSEEAGVGPD